MKKEHYILLGGGALLLFLLLRNKKGRCPLESVMYWRPIAEQISMENYNVYKSDVTANILAVIHDQSQGDEKLIYYVGGVWKRYGLCGVPLAWAQQFNPEIRPEDLMNPEMNIRMALKIIAYIDIKIRTIYREAGISLGDRPAFSSNAYSGYYNSDTMDISGAAIHNKQTISQYMDLLSCYRQTIKF